jgi:hypothetical protein
MFMWNVKCIYHSRELEPEIGSHKNPVILLVLPNMERARNEQQ